MKAEDLRITELLEGAKQFIVPVFQRDYNWGTKHCLQLWEDIERVGADDNTRAHFVGSIVYIAAEETSAKITRWLLIDGQQRLTSLTLLLAALRESLPIKDHEEKQDQNDALPTVPELDDYYLMNRYGAGARRYKLHLRRSDFDTLVHIIDPKEKAPSVPSRHIQENYEFFKDRLQNADPEVVYRGIRKLVAVDVHLDRGNDDPQMIFESLNSTGMDLTQADLIRNFVLMRQDEEYQSRLYSDYWRPIELAFGSNYGTEFDRFVRDFLTLKLEPSKQLRADEIYHLFRNHFNSIGGVERVEEILQELLRFGKYYVAFILGKEPNKRLKEVFARLRLQVEVASPVIIKLYDCYERLESLTLDGFVEAVELLESYIFRRSVCAMQTRSLGQIFASIAYRIKEDSPLESLKVVIYRQSKKRRFPSNLEFREGLETRDVYDMRHCHYLLDRIENDSKEKIDTSTFTIEHVLPQNDQLRPEWQNMLGEDWANIQEIWINRLGNITLTGYNSEYSDRPFMEKKTINGGFNESPLRLNKFISDQEEWTQLQIEERGKLLAEKALAIWPQLDVDLQAVKEAELEEIKKRAAGYKLENLIFNDFPKEMFELLRPRILSLGDDVVELCTSKTLTFRVYDFFLEVIPRARYLALVINLDIDNCDDPSQLAIDATEYAFVTHATERGGVLFELKEHSQIDAAMHIIRQAYEEVAE